MWQRFGFGRKQNYELDRLIDSRHRFNGRERVDEQIICDIDKTYLETEFDSWLQIARTALQDAEDKITVTAASEVLMMLRWGGFSPTKVEETCPRPLHFVSSSPPQMRSKLEDKMLLDGIDWSSDTFKNQAYNLLTGRMDLLRHHVAYKSAAILRLVGNSLPTSRFHLIGDSAESDAYTYLGIYLFTSGILSLRGYQTYLTLAGVDEGVAKSLLKSYEIAEEKDKLGKIASISIRQIARSPLVEQEGLTEFIDRFSSFPELGFIFLRRGLIEPQFLSTWLVHFNNRHRLQAEKLLVLVRAFEDTEDASPNSLSDAFAKARRRLERLVYAEDGHRLLNSIDIEKEVAAVTSHHRLYTPGIHDERLVELGEEGILKHCQQWLDKAQETRRALTPRHQK